MINNLTSTLDFHSKALVVRAERQRLIASNIANADTPGYVGRDLNFKDALQAATGGKQLTLPLTTANSHSASTHPGHIALTRSTASMATGEGMAYTVQTQPSVDGNSVDLDRERSNFVDNAVRYEATLRFINGQSRTLLSAIQGQ